MQQGGTQRRVRKPQKQQRPGSERRMRPHPVFDRPEVKGNGKLKNKIALVTGGDSGIGKAVAILFAKEGADVIVAYLKEHKDARDTKKISEQQYQRTCLLIRGDETNPERRLQRGGLNEHVRSQERCERWRLPCRRVA